MSTRKSSAETPRDPSRSPRTVGSPPRSPSFVDRTGTSLFIHPFEQTNYGALLEFYDEYPSRHRSMSLPPLPTSQVESWLDRLLERGQHLLATHGDDLIGHVAYSPRAAPEAELVVFVDEAYHDRGIGTELCRHAIAHAAADGHEALILFVDRQNERAIHVYESLGFRTVSGDGEEPIEMRLELDEEVASEFQALPQEAD